MHPPRSPLLQRILATAGAVTVTAMTAFVAPASADHPARPGEPQPGEAQPGEDCRPWAPTPHPFVKVRAERNRFDARCLEAPADKRFRIYLENHDTEKHNLSIYSADPEQDEQAETIFKGESVSGRGSRSDRPPRADYAVDALPPGDYFFRDDNVKGMNGVIRVRKDDED